MTCCLCAAMLLSSCVPSTPVEDDGTAATTAPADMSSQTNDNPVVSVTATFDETDLSLPDVTNAVAVSLSDDGTTVSGGGVTVNGSVVTFTSGGCYVVSGGLSNGQLRVEAKDQTVQLILNGVTVHSDTGAPLFVKKSQKTVLTLAEGTVNTFSDADTFAYEDETEQEPSSTVFSKSDLTINGSGTLNVQAVFNDGIVSRDGLKIADGQIIVEAADDALMGRDYVLIGGGTVSLNADGDGLKSTNVAGEQIGFVEIVGGTLHIESAKDGIQAESYITVTDGAISVVSGGGSQNGSANSANDFGWGTGSVDSESVGKGLKAGTVLTISGGTLSVDAADDALHSNNEILVSGGNTTAAAGDDGIHADTLLTVSGGTVTLTNSYEGFEAATIRIDGGDISITASDDGINASSGSSETSGDRGFGGNPFESDDSAWIINGGTLYVNAQGDGLDSNGSATMNGGIVSVVGPSNSGNGTFDYASSFSVRGGTLIAIGSLGMAQTPTSNTLNNIVWSGCSMAAGEVFSLTDASGTVIAEIEALRAAQWAYVTSDAMQTGETYTATAGSQQESVTLESGGNTIGSSYGNMGGMMGGGNMGGPGGMGRPGGRW